MTTWSEQAEDSTSYTASSKSTGYVAEGYCNNSYVRPMWDWKDEEGESTTWAQSDS